MDYLEERHFKILNDKVYIISNPEEKESIEFQKYTHEYQKNKWLQKKK